VTSEHNGGGRRIPTRGLHFQTEGDRYYIVTGEGESFEVSEDAYKAAVALVEYGAEAIPIDGFTD